MHLRRLRKQVIYAALFSMFWVIVIGGPVLLTSRPNQSRPTITPLPTTTPQPIAVQSVDVIQHAGTVDVVTRLHNSNPRLGIVHYPVEFILVDSANAEIKRVTVNSHILPGSLQYVTALNVPLEQPVAKVTLKTPDQPTYTELPANITLPSFSTFLQDRRTHSIGGQAIVEQKGVVTNNSSLDWQHVEVTALAFDSSNKVIGVGTTFVGRLTSGEQREFTIQWPDLLVPVARVVTLATTNIFKEDNIIRAVGDPSRLR